MSPLNVDNTNLTSNGMDIKILPLTFIRSGLFAGKVYLRILNIQLRFILGIRQINLTCLSPRLNPSEEASLYLGCSVDLAMGATDL